MKCGRILITNIHKKVLRTDYCTATCKTAESNLWTTYLRIPANNNHQQVARKDKTQSTKRGKNKSPKILN